MRYSFYYPVVLGFLALLMLPGCLRDKCTTQRTYKRYDPIYKTAAECNRGFQVQPVREMAKPGKIYYFDHYLFINEQNEGIHVIDNSDPANPVKIAFWSIPGNVDMAIRGHYLYVDQYINLMTVDIENIAAPQMVCYRENAFSLYGFNPQRGWLVGYDVTEVTEEFDCNDDRWNSPWIMEGDVILTVDQFDGASSNGGANVPAGIAGSYSRFGLADQYLYTVDNSTLKSWSLAQPDCPAATDSVVVGWNIETLFPWKDRLFVGSQQGVFIFNNSNPKHPVLESTFWHATGCDPVVCDENYAYVTLHDGTTCNGTLNQLEVINIGSLPAATLEATYSMKRPFGLSVSDQYLYLCDDGLKIYDKSQATNLQQLAHLKELNATDVISLDNDHLLLIGEDGFFQIDVSNPASPKLISQIRK